jgi:hypothetical protein
VAACFVGAWLWRYDLTHGGDLNAPMKSAQQEFTLVLNGQEEADNNERIVRSSRTSNHSVSSVHSELLALR